MTSFEQGLIGAYAATDEGAQGMAAADLAAQVVRLLDAAIGASPLDQRSLAKKIGVTEGRVSQVLNSDGNLRIAALARYMRALGYELELTAKPVDEGLPAIPAKVPTRARRKTPKLSADALLDEWEKSFKRDAEAISRQLFVLRSKPVSAACSYQGFNVDATWAAGRVAADWHAVVKNDGVRTAHSPCSVSHV